MPVFTYLSYLRKRFYNPTIPTFVLALLAIFLIGYTYWVPDGRLHLKFYDVGQGDSIFIKTPEGNKVLIDGGPSASLVNKISWEFPLFNHDLDLMLLTHPDTDHVTGLIEVLKRYDVKNVVLESQSGSSVVYKAFAKALEEEIDQGANVYYVKKGDKIRLGQVGIDILWPEYTIESKSSVVETNDYSIVAGLRYKDYKAVFTSDQKHSVLEKILKGSDFYGVDLLKVPHHGSKYGLDGQTLGILQPKLAVISVGKSNKYGHPSSEILDLLSTFKIKTLRTDTSGTIEVTTNGSSTWVNK